jgi:hypothetical protein
MRYILIDRWFVLSNSQIPYNSQYRFCSQLQFLKQMAQIVSGFEVEIIPQLNKDQI